MRPFVRLALLALLLLSFVLTAVSAQAGPIGIQVLSPTYATTVTVLGETRTLTGPNPVSDNLQTYIPGIPTFPASASAEADFLRVSTSTSTPWGSTKAIAETELVFSPLADATASFGVVVEVAKGNHTGGYASLFDTTVNQLMWSYWWSGVTSVPPYPYPGEGEELAGLTSGPEGWASRTVATDLSRSHVYALQLYTGSDAYADATAAQVQVTGVEAVPESLDTLVCLCMGVGVIVGARKRFWLFS